MTRRSLSVLVTMLVGLLIAVSSATVHADFADQSGSSATAVPIMADQPACTHPLVGIPTCYSQQADGTWARVEIMKDESLATAFGQTSGAVWYVIGTVTYDEVVAAVGDVNAKAP